jgi:hypothetical protein
MNQRANIMINEHIILSTLHSMVFEQTTATNISTDNANSSDKGSPFTPAEKRFLGKFDAYGSKHLGILYSASESGIREFISRSGHSLNITPGILLGLVRDGIIKVVPYAGFGRNTDYTLELQLSLDDIKGFGDADRQNAEKSANSSPPGDAGALPEPPAPINAGVNKRGNILKEFSKSELMILKKLLYDK